MATEQDDTADFAARIRRNQSARLARLRTSFDYIVCGAGASGCVVAARLAAADPKTQVLVLEAGGDDETDLVHDPMRWPATLGSELDWGFAAEPNPRLNGRAIAYSMGKVLGGGSSINVATWSRGHRADWDSYAAAAANPAWSYERVLDLYRTRIEAWAGEPDPAYRGTAGAVCVQPPPQPDPFALALLEGAQSAGLPGFPNANGAMMEAASGCALVDETVRDKRRCSIFRTYLYPLMDRSNVTVVTGAIVTQLLFARGCAVGVEFDHGGVRRRASAAGEIVLSLGAIQTPKLLMQSGIGDEAELAQVGIPAVQPLPGVGRNLHDHIAFGCVWQGTERAPAAGPRSQTACFWKSRAELEAPNFYAYSRRGPDMTPENAARFVIPPATWSLVVGMRPRSRGAITLTGPAPADPVRIDANYLGDPRDMDDLFAGLETARAIGGSAPLRPFTIREVAPGRLGKAALATFFRNGLGTFWHQCGTARMGRDPMSVVDAELRVYGFERLRIADASILPQVTTGNTMAPCVVIGEQAARFLGASSGIRASGNLQEHRAGVT